MRAAWLLSFAVGCGSRTGLVVENEQDAGAVDTGVVGTDVGSDVNNPTPDVAVLDTCSCASGETETASDGCSVGGFRSRTCGVDCEWSEWSPCTTPVWTPTAPAPEGRRRHDAFWTGSEMIVYGGVAAKTEADAYAPATNSWRRLPPSSLAFAEQHMLTWTGDRLVIMSKADGRFRTSAFDPSSNVWTLLPDAPIAPRRWTTVVHVPATRELFVWGGGDHDGGFGDGAALQLDTRTWRLLSPSPLTARYQPTVIASEDAVLVYGGGHVTSDATAFDDAAVWYPKSNSWKYLGKTSIGARRFAFGLRDGAQSFVIGGLSVADTTSAEPATFDFPSRTFTLHGATWSPFSTEAASPEWTAWTGGGLLFVYGPFTFEPFNSGAWFDPHTNKWTPLAPGGVSSRAFLSAVWTGTQAIVWGGCCDDAGRPFADGAIYTP